MNAEQRAERSRSLVYAMRVIDGRRDGDWKEATRLWCATVGYVRAWKALYVQALTLEDPSLLDDDDRQERLARAERTRRALAFLVDEEYRRRRTRRQVEQQFARIVASIDGGSPEARARSSLSQPSCGASRRRSGTSSSRDGPSREPDEPHDPVSPARAGRVSVRARAVA